MSSNASTLIDTKTPSLHQSSSQNHDVQEPESSSASKPPPYFRNSPLEDPFRDGDAPVGYFYPNDNGIQKGLKAATATHLDPAPATTVTLVDPPPPVPIVNSDPFVGGMVLDEDLPPPLPLRPSGLRRGLQIPSRVSHITFGFSFPEVLAEEGVNKEQWRLFKHELETFACLSISQHINVMGCGFLVGHFFGPLLCQYMKPARFDLMLLNLVQLLLSAGK